MGATCFVTAVILLGCVGTGMFASQQQVVSARRAAAPGELFSLWRFEIRAPLVDGWLVFEASESRLTLIRRDALTGNTYGAGVTVLLLSPSQPDLVKLGQFAKQNLPEIGKQFVLQGAPSQRMEILEMNVESSTDREYPCVRSRAKIQDTQARTVEITPFLEIHVRELTCLVPGQPDALVNISFSERGKSAASDLDSQANSFFDGVQIPPTR